MNHTRYDVLGIGNAIFDVLGHVTDEALQRHGLVKGAMRLVSAKESAAADALLADAVRVAGGSAGNTIAGVCSLGGRGAFIGKVADDEFGDAYANDLRRVGVAFDTPRLAGGAPTATSVILVTPDGERTMNTFLGASRELTIEDIDAALVESAAITFLEGYLFDPDAAKRAFRTAAERAVGAGRTAALTLSDPFCVERHRTDFLAWIQSGQIGLIFANEAEARALYETEDLDVATSALAGAVPTVVITRGPRGARVVREGDAVEVPAHPAQVVDLTGAGDLFAGGFMLGHARGLPAAECADLGALAAAEVISHIGARPQTSLAQLAREAGYRL